MKKKLIILVTVFLLCGYSTLIIAQDGVSLIDKLERVTSEKEPQWKLDRKLPTEKLVVLRWSSGEARVFMSITLVDSPNKAKDIFESSLARLNQQFGPKATKYTVPNLGTDSQLWTGYDDAGSAAMQFRQGNVHVLLFTPSEDVAKRFARYVADLLPPSKTSQAENSSQSWKEYSSVEGGFSILFPVNPSQETQVIEAGPGVQFNLRIHRVKTIAEYSVMYADYSIPVGDPEVARKVLDNLLKAPNNGS